MTDADADRIDIKLENLEASVKRIEDLILREISDLKNEQIADLRRENERLADDQRRMWDALRSLEADRNRVHGGGAAIRTIIATTTSLLGGSVAAVLVAKFLK